MMKYILGLLLGFFQNIVNAQNYLNIASISYANTPLNNFENASKQTKVEEFG